MRERDSSKTLSVELKKIDLNKLLLHLINVSGKIFYILHFTTVPSLFCIFDKILDHAYCTRHVKNIHVDDMDKCDDAISIYIFKRRKRDQKKNHSR